MSLDKYREARKRTEEALSRFSQDAERFEGRIVDRLTELLTEFDTQGGNLVASDRNINRISEVVAGLRSDLVDDDWIGSVDRYIDAFDTAGDGVLDHARSLGDVEQGSLDALRRQFARATTEFLLDEQTYSKSLLMPLQEALSTGIATGAPLKDLVRTIRTLARSTGESPGAVVAAVQAPAERAVTIYERTASEKVADALGVEIYFYQGRNIDTTRPFCKERAGHAWHRKEIEEWGREAKDGEGWAGMVDGTDEKTIFVYLGGWFGERNSCRHVLVPIDIADAPAEDVARMRAKGLLTEQVATTAPVPKTPKPKAPPKPKKTQIDKKAFFSTGDAKYDKAYAQHVADQDGVADITRKYRTVHGLLFESETLNTPRIRDRIYKTNPSFRTDYQDPLAGNMGVARRDKGFLLIRLQDGHSVVAKGYDAEMREFQDDARAWLKKYGGIAEPGKYTGLGFTGEIVINGITRAKFVQGKARMWSISTIGRVVDKNVIGTVTHEMAHLVAFEHDPAVLMNRTTVAPPKLFALAKARRVTLQDAPTLYGESNWDEFWAESFAAYVHMPQWFKSTYPKAHDLFMEALAAYGVDPKTIKQYK